MVIRARAWPSLRWAPLNPRQDSRSRDCACASKRVINLEGLFRRRPLRSNLVPEAAFAVVLLCSLVCRAGSVPVDHLVGLPAAKPFEIPAVPAGLSVLVRPRVPVLVRVDVRDTCRASTAVDRLGYASGR